MGINTQLLGQRLADARELQGRSLGEVAASAGIAKSYLLRLERGEVENPGLATLDGVAKALGRTLADLLASGGGEGKSGHLEAAMELVRENMSPSLTQFLAILAERNERLTADGVQSLARIQFRGKRPETVADWEFIYQAVKRSLK